MLGVESGLVILYVLYQEVKLDGKNLKEKEPVFC